MTSHEEIRVHGIVQGVGFRPFVFRLAREERLDGDVRNESGVVMINVAGPGERIEAFVAALRDAPPPLARIDRIEQMTVEGGLPQGFSIGLSLSGEIVGGEPAVSPDTAICRDCRADIFNPDDRHFRYPFTNCTNCGPRLSILRAIPYDRCNTSMAAFSMCAACAREYHDPADRRFHAQPNACPACGPRARLIQPDGSLFAPKSADAPTEAWALLRQGEILAIKGLGGYHLACLATDEAAVARLRRRKRRSDRPFAMMARDTKVVARYAEISKEERSALESPEAPIVILEAKAGNRLAPSIAPRQRTLGFALPYSPLHVLLLERAEVPIVLTSGNLSDEPLVIDDAEALAKLGPIVDALLVHDRKIVNHVDDSVVRFLSNYSRQIRRARGYAPATIPCPPGFEKAPEVLALGAHLKSTFCLLRDGQAIVSQHIGDLDDAATRTVYQDTLDQYLRLFDRDPEVLAVDMHPDMASVRLGEELAETRDLKLVRVQHHHSHAASCMAENNLPLDTSPVLAVVLDGLGYGPDGSFWGGEFLLADYAGYRRLGSFRPVPMPGGEQAIREPWRMAYAHLARAFAWPEIAERYRTLPFFTGLRDRPLDTLDAMMKRGINSPMTSACGRLFDAVAAVVGLRETVTYDGQAAIEFEAAADPDLALRAAEEVYAYPFGIEEETAGVPAELDPKPMWGALLDDLARGVQIPIISVRFHVGLARGIDEMIEHLATRLGATWRGRVALSGGVFQNALLFELLTTRLQSRDIEVISQQYLPSNDGGLAWGQAAIAAALALGRVSQCASRSPDA